MGGEVGTGQEVSGGWREAIVYQENGDGGGMRCPEGAGMQEVSKGRGGIRWKLGGQEVSKGRGGIKWK
jgi:hypothetical protein